MQTLKSAGPRNASFRGMLAILGGIAFVALTIGLLALSPKHVGQYLWNYSDPYWMWLATGTAALIAVMFPIRQGRPLFLLLAVVIGLILITPMVTGATGLAIPKLALLTVLALGLGHAILRRVVGDAELDLTARISLSGVLGYGALALTMLFVGLVNGYRWYVVSPLLVALAAAARRDIADLYRQVANAARALRANWSHTDMRLESIVLGCLCISGFGAYLFAIAPVTHWDVLHYHLSIPTIYVERGGLVDLNHTFAAQLIRNADMLYLLGLVLEGQPLPTLINFVLAILGVGAMVAFGTEVAGRRVGLLAGAAMFSVPLVTYVLAYGLIDQVVVTFVVAGAFCFFRWQSDRTDRWLALFGIISGLAAGTKFNAMMSLMPMAVVMIVQRMAARGSEAGGLGSRFASIAKLVASGAIVWGPWLVLAWVRTGNPIFPFLNTVFKSPYWHQTDFDQTCDWRHFGVGRTLWDGVKMPWNIAFHGEKFGELGWFATAGITMLGLPLLLTAQSPARRRSMLMLSGLLAVQLAMFFQAVHYSRYMLPVFALFVIVAAMNFETLVDASQKLGRVGRVPVMLCVVLGLSWVVYTRAVHLTTLGSWYHGRYPYQLALGRCSQDEYLTKSSMWAYDFLKFVKDKTSPGKPITYIGINVGCGVYCGDAVEYSIWHSLAGKKLVTETSRDALFTEMKKYGIGHLAVDMRLCRNDPFWLSQMESSACLNPEFLARHCRLLFSRNGINFFKIDTTPHLDVDPFGVSLLRNDTFDSAEDGEIECWKSIDASHIPKRITTVKAADGRTLLEVADGAWVFQKCDVAPDRLYTFTAELESSLPEQVGLVEIHWLDSHDRVLKIEHLSFQTGGKGKQCEISSTSTANAARALVGVRAKAGSKVLAQHPRLYDREKAEVMMAQAEANALRR